MNINMELPPGAITLYLSPAEAAELINVHPQTLQNWRRARTGPPFTRIGGQIRYRRTSLERWLEANTMQPCGNEVGI